MMDFMHMKDNKGNATEYEPVGEVVRIFQRGQVWWVNFQRGGRQNRVSLRTTNKKEARRRALRIEAELLDGCYESRPKPPSLQNAMQEYLDHLRAERRAPKTLVQYERVLRNARELLESRRATTLRDLDLRAIDAYRQMRVKAGAAPVTVHTETVILRQLVNFALKRGLIAEDPLRGLKLREPKPRPQPCWTPEEVERILGSAPINYRIALIVLADTGMRFAELAHLTWDDVDFTTNVLRIRPKDGWTTKSGDQRTIPMSPRIRALLQSQSHRTRWVVTSPPSRKYPKGDHQISERRMLLALKKVLVELGLPGHLHTFRHSFISKALTSGIPEAVVREWVGHVDRDIMKLYTHIASSTSQEAMRHFSATTEGTTGEEVGS
jgi:site-specific recombinase XerD